MHRRDNKSWGVLGDETEWKVSSGDADRKETNISKGIIKKEGAMRFESSGCTVAPVADFCNEKYKKTANYV
jgi:hypothetical protein